MTKLPFFPIVATIVFFLLHLLGCKPQAEKLDVVPDPSNDVMHIVFAANNIPYLEGAGVAIFSILTHAEPTDSYKFYIYITEKLAEENLPVPQIEAFNTLREDFQSIAQIEIIPLKELPLPDNVNPSLWGQAGLLRLFLPDLMPSISKIIYLDCDFLALKNIKPIHQTLHLNDSNWIAAVKDIYHELHTQKLRQNFGCKDFPDNTYVNSGLLVMNLDQLRTDHFVEKTINWLNLHDADMPDQDAINVLYYKHLRVLDFPYAWPITEKHANFPPETLMLQFIGDHKPWLPENTIEHTPHLDLYQHYRSLSPWGNTIE